MAELVLLALVVGGYVSALAFVALIVAKVHAAQSDLTKTVIHELREVTNRALVLQGLNPHVVDPKTYGPTGMARADEEAQAAKVAAAQEEALSQDEESLRTAEEAYFAALAKQVNASANGSQN